MEISFWAIQLTQKSHWVDVKSISTFFLPSSSVSCTGATSECPVLCCFSREPIAGGTQWAEEKRFIQQIARIQEGKWLAVESALLGVVKRKMLKHLLQGYYLSLRRMNAMRAHYATWVMASFGKWIMNTLSPPVFIKSSGASNLRVIVQRFTI